MKKENDILNYELKFDSEHISHFNTNENFLKRKKLIEFHYTSANALKFILSDNPSIRLTDIRYMNDHSEVVYFVKCIIQFLLDNKNNYPYCWEIVNDLLLKEYSANDYINLVPTHVIYSNNEFIFRIKPQRLFLFCLSESPDSLNMWNYYVKNGKYEGYNIGFDIYNLIKSFDYKGNKSEDNNYSDILFGKVLYDEKVQNSEIKKLLNTLERFGEKTAHANDDNLNELAKLFLMFKIESVGAFFKDEAFKNEKEFRVLFCISGDNLQDPEKSFNNPSLKKLKLEFFERNGILVPSLIVPINKEAITQVTVSPTIEKELAKMSMEEFLTVNGYKANVSFSNIPIRF